MKPHYRSRRKRVRFPNPLAFRSRFFQFSLCQWLQCHNGCSKLFRHVQFCNTQGNLCNAHNSGNTSTQQSSYGGGNAQWRKVKQTQQLNAKEGTHVPRHPCSQCHNILLRQQLSCDNIEIIFFATLADRRPFQAGPVLIDHIWLADCHFYYYWLADSHYILLIIVIRITIAPAGALYAMVRQYRPWEWVGEPDQNRPSNRQLLKFMITYDQI